MPDQLAKMLRQDLEAAGIAYKDAAGRVADFHALRHTFITNLARVGVHPKMAMDLARHSTIGLTMERYSHTVARDRAEGLKGFPDLNGKPDEKESHRATGTIDSQPLTSEKEPWTTSRTTSREKAGRKPSVGQVVEAGADGLPNRRSQVRVLAGAFWGSERSSPPRPGARRPSWRLPSVYKPSGMSVSCVSPSAGGGGSSGDSSGENRST